MRTLKKFSLYSFLSCLFLFFQPRLAIAKMQSSADVRALARKVMKDLMGELKAKGPKGSGVAGAKLIVEGEVSFAKIGEEIMVPIDAPKIEENWGCNEDPKDGTTEVELTYDKTFEKRKDGISAQIIVQANGTWFLDTGRDTALVGVTKDQDGDPIEAASIEARNVKTGETFSEKTDANGQYKLMLPSGSYQLSFQKKKCEPVRKSQLICGWGPVLTPNQRNPEFNWDVKAVCEKEAEAFSQAISHLAVHYDVPEVGRIQWNESDRMSLHLKQTQKKKNGKFWEGKWEGILQQHFFIDIQREIVEKYFKGTAWLRGAIQQEPVKTKVHLFLYANPKGPGLSPLSYALLQNQGRASGMHQQTFLLPQGPTQIGGPWSATPSFAVGRSKLELIQETKDFIKLKIKNCPPFDSATLPPGITVKVTNPAVITIQKKKS